MKLEQKSTIILLLSFSIIAISFAAIFVKWSGAPSTISSMYRMFMASILLLPIVIKNKIEFKRLPKRGWFLLIFAGVFLALHFALWFGSLKLTTVASSTIILSLQPIIALIGGYFIYKEKASLQTILIICLAIFGVAMVAWGDFGSSKEALIGDLLSFLSVIAVVCYLLIGQTVVKKLSPWVYSFLVFFIAGCTLFVYNLMMNVNLIHYSHREWGIFFLLAVFPTIAYVIFNMLLQYVNTTTISMCNLGEPVGATILAALLLDEYITPFQLFGGLLALSGVFYYLYNQKDGYQSKKAELTTDIGS